MSLLLDRYTPDKAIIDIIPKLVLLLTVWISQWGYASLAEAGRHFSQPPGTQQVALVNSVAKVNGQAMLTVTVRLVDAETDTTIINGKLLVTDEKTGQAIPVLSDSSGFKLSAQPGTSLIVQASAPDYLAAKTRIVNLALAQRLIIKLAHIKPSVLTIKAFARPIDQPLARATAVITSQTTGKADRFELENGRLERRFTKPDDFAIQVSAPGYSTDKRQLRIDVSPTGKRYEFEIGLDKITIRLAIRAVDRQTDKSITGGRFRLNGPTGMTPIVLSPSPEIGLFMANLPGKGAYTLIGNAEGYEDISFMIMTSKEQNEILVKLKPIPPAVEPKPEITVAAAKPAELKMTPTAVSALARGAVSTKTFGVIEKGRSIRLNKIYFDQSSPVLRPESFTELDQLYDVLMQYPSLRIEIHGHTDNQGDFDLNTQLSRNRCQSVINYLAGKGVRKTRLKAVGRGPLDPVAPNNNEENRRKNRRVEFILL